MQPADRRAREAAGDVGHDPMFRNVDLTHRLELPVMGVPVRFESNSASAIDAAHRSFGSWQIVTERPDLCNDDPVRVRLFVHDAPHADRSDAIVYRWPDPNRLLLHSSDAAGVIEIDRREAYAFVGEALVARDDAFRYAVVEAMTLMLVTHSGRHPVHAAVVARGVRGVLLAGRSGAGKSSIAFAALQAGLRVLSDETAYVQLTPAVRVWSHPRDVNLPLEAAAAFSELADHSAVPLPTGKTKIVAAPASALWSPGIPMLEHAVMCLLSPVADTASIAPATPQEIEHALTHDLEPGYDMAPSQRASVASRLATGGGWRLQPAKDPAAAIPLLRDILDESAGAGR